MPIGTKMGSVKKLKETLQRQGGQSFIQYIPKNGSVTVRFIQEPDEWVGYSEHWDASLRKSYPCVADELDECPGCKSEERKSFRYLANVVLIENNKPTRAVPFQMPKDLATRLHSKYEKYGTLMDRDYELERSGEGLDTTYDASAEPPMARKLTGFDPLDLEDVLVGAFSSVFGEAKPTGKGTTATSKAKAAQKAEKTEKTVKTAGRAKAAANKAAAEPEPDVEEDDLDDDALDLAVLGKNADADDADAIDMLVELADEAGLDTDDFDTWSDLAEHLSAAEPADTEEANDEDDEDGEGDESFTEEELGEMSLTELRSIAKEYDITTAGKAKPVLIQAIMEAEAEGNGEDEDDEE